MPLVAIFMYEGCGTDRMKLLTASPWEYTEVYTQYNSSRKELVFQAGQVNNRLDLSNERVKFNEDGTVYDTAHNGHVYIGTWQFINNQTQYQTNINGAISTANINTLNGDNFIWFDPDNSGGEYSTMIHIP